MIYFAPVLNAIRRCIWSALILLAGMSQLKAQGLLIQGQTWTVVDTSVHAIELGGDRFERSTEGLQCALQHSGKQVATFIDGSDARSTKTIRVMPDWLALIPPLVAIVLALVFREVVTALLLGILSGTLIMGWYTQGISGLFPALLEVVEVHVLQAIVPDPVDGSVSRGHISVILFSVMIGGIVGVISHNGGMNALVKSVSKYATNAQSGMFATWLMGVLIFFDDYANTLIVGNTMRPVTDSLRISREKLAYIVDSTAAPVAALAFITTWIGAELGYIAGGLEQISDLSGSVYAFFFASLKYSFYPILTLIFMLFLIWKQRDFGPMLQAENDARNHGINEQKTEELSQDFTKLSGSGLEQSRYALIPIALIVFGTMAGLLYTGWDRQLWSDAQGGWVQKLSTIIGNSDSYKALLWASFSGLIAAVGITVIGGINTLSKTIDMAIEGFKSMVPAIMILVFAWALAGITEQLQAASYMTGLLQGAVSPYFIPLITFILAAVIAFSTGTSWGTMAILYPVMLGTSWFVGKEYGLSHEQNLEIFYNVISCVLAGSVLGDHCSPISDTTILSSLASQCDHVAHVRTQLPYALTVGLVSVVFGTLLVHIIPVWLCMILAIACLYLVVSYLGKMHDTSTQSD